MTRIKECIYWLVPAECLRDRRFWLLLAVPLFLTSLLAIALYWPRLSSIPSLGLPAVLSRWTPLPRIDNVLIVVCGMLLPLALLARVLDQQGGPPFRLAFSWRTYGISVALLIVVILLGCGGLRSACGILAALSIVSAFLVWVPVGEYARRIRRNPVPAMIALVAVLSPVVYLFFSALIWKYIDVSTAYMVRAVIALFGIDTTASFRHISIILRSQEFGIRIYTPCSGVEGIMLLFYVLSVFLLIDWRLFARTHHIVEWYLAGIFYMLAINVLRIAGIFLYGHALRQRTTQDEAATRTVELFHSNAGWMLYAVALTLFLWVLYRWAGAAAARRKA
ncbi:MAG TPA: hypothetical protein PKC45_04305 [Gemmatales bacterium]|nr:hypothetical protein [Gemmatales bacterium]